MAAKPQLTAADESAIRDTVAALLPELANPEPALSEKARNALLTPLRCAQVSRDFRLKFGAATGADLMRLATAPTDHTALNALRIAGELGTATANDALRRGLADARSSVRCMAALGFRDMLRGVASGNAVIVASSVEPMLDLLAKQLETETDVFVVENLILALDATRADPALHAQAMRRLAPALARQSQALRARAETLDHQRWQVVLIRGIDAVTVPMTEAAGRVDQAYRVQAALLAGQSLAYVRSRFEAESAAGLAASVTEQESMKTLVNTAERVLLLAESSIRSTQPPRQTLLPQFEEALRSGEEAGFVMEIAGWLGEAGRLTKAPYAAKPGDFQ